MVDMMETAPEIARALFEGDQTLFWTELAENLNALGPPIRPSATSKRVWYDYKCAVKKKMRLNNNSIHATGGGPCRLKPLNELKERVLNLTNLKLTIVGNTGNTHGYHPPPAEINNDQSTANHNNNTKSNNEQTNNDGENQEPIPSRIGESATQPTTFRRGRKRKNNEEVLKTNKELQQDSS